MGDRPKQDPAEREFAATDRKVLMLTVTFVTLVLAALAVRTGNAVLLVSQGVFGLTACAAAILIGRGFEVSGRYLFWAASNFVIFVHADSLPLSSMMSLLFLLTILFPMLSWQARGWRSALGPAVASAVVWAICISQGPGLLFQIADSPQSFSPFFAVTSVAGILGLWLFRAQRRVSQLRAEVAKHSQESACQHRMVALAQLAAEVAHDVNNPLTLILAKAERISRRTRSNKAFDEQIDADALRVVQTVDRIALTIARLHASARHEIDFEREYGASHELNVSNTHR